VAVSTETAEVTQQADGVNQRSGRRRRRRRRAAEDPEEAETT